MNDTHNHAELPQGNFLQRLLHDRRGNVMVLMTSFLLPMMVLVGSAVDVSRTYVAKTRLQQACDAGALAGRKLMTVSSGTALDDASATPSKPAETIARSFFNNNFTSGWMGSTSVSFTPVRTSDGQVSATATATVPMSIMKIFGSDNSVTTVTCTARYDLPDLDVMFVLDNTGSMADAANDTCPSGGESGATGLTNYTRADGTIGRRSKECGSSKMQGLRNGVLSFYDTIAATLSPGAHVRYGFVPYSSGVNVGGLLNSSWLVDSAVYPSRRIVGDTNFGSATTDVQTGIPATNCVNYRVPAGTLTYTVNGQADVRTVQSWTAAAGGTCTFRVQSVKPLWRYENVSQDTSTFKLGTTVDDPTKISAVTSKWQGCVEERGNAAPASSFTLTSLPLDLDPDAPVVSSDDNTKWRPSWPEVVYYRDNYTSIDYTGPSTNPYGDTTSTSSEAIYTNVASSFNIDSLDFSCGKSAKRLSEMTRTQVSDYVSRANGFVAFGTTYHDVGMIWGTRLISPTGLFASDTSAWSGHTEPSRFIIFMSDGAMNTNTTDYGLWGVEKYANRVKGSLSTNLNTLHGTRFTTACAAAKARNIKVYTIYYGTGGITSDMVTCASPGSSFTAPSDGALGTIFDSIARDIAALRLSQ